MNKQIINAAMKQSGHYVDASNGILYVSKSFQTNANYYGTTEYHKMNEILAVYPDMKIELYAATRKKRLTYELMEARGRYRGDLETLYLFERDTDEPLVVPDEFLDIQLFEEDKRKLRLYFSIKDKKGHYLSYDKQWSRLEASGYDIDYGRSNNRHYVIIRKP